MKYKLNVKLILSYLCIALFLVGLIAVITNIAFEKEFKKYVMKIQEDKNQEVVISLSNEYQQRGDEWDNVNFEEIGMDALEQGLIIKIVDTNNNVLWDAMQHNSGMCAQMLAEMAHNMKKYYPDFDGKYTSKEYSLKIDNDTIGSISIGYYGPYYFNENDIAFLKTFNQVLFMTAVVSFVISFCLGIFISRQITNNITNIIKITKEIANGNYKHRITEKSDTKEIIELMDAVNNLAVTLDRQEQLRNDLTADIAHELRTPISTLQSHLEAVKDGVWELTPERVDSLYEEIIRISKIVNDLHNLTSYDNNDIVLNKTPFDIKPVLSKIINNFMTEADDKKISIKLLGKDLNITADRDKVIQLFINLISNALKYTSSKGHIKITIGQLEKYASITVEDDGIGISEEDLPYIFERFYRADKSRSRATGGSGIGLSIVRNIVNAHEGKIDIVSKLNEGTKVIVMLPL